MKILNKNKETIETNNYDKCLELVKLSTVPNDELNIIMKQVKSIIDELEAIGQPIDELEIVSEVLDQNEYEFINSKQAKPLHKSLKIDKSGREIVLTDEALTKLDLDVKLGGAILDLRNFNFTGGDLLLNINASFSGVEIYINEDVAVSDWIENKLSGVSYNYNNTDYDNINKLPEFETKHEITLEGKVKASGITFRIGHVGDYVNEMNHQGTPLHGKTEEQLDAKLESELNKIEVSAEKKRIKAQERIERKKARLNNKKA